MSRPVPSPTLPSCRHVRLWPRPLTTRSSFFRCASVSKARPTRRRQPMTAPMVPIALADRQGSRRADRLVDPVPRGGSRSLRPRSAWARPDKCSRPWLRRPVADVKAEPPHSFRSSNLEAAVRTSRVMILASRSRSGSIHAATSAPPLTGRWPERVVVAVS